MATSDTLSPGTFAVINRALMQTNPVPTPLNAEASPIFGNDAAVEGTKIDHTFEA